MPRLVPGQLSLFDDFPAGLFATTQPAGPVRPEPVPDRLVLSLIVGGKAAGMLMGLGDSLGDRHGIAMTDYADIFHLPLYELGESADFGERQREKLAVAAGKLTLPRFNLSAREALPVTLGADLPALAIEVAPSEALEHFADHLAGALRAAGLGDWLNPADSPAILLGRTRSDFAPVPLARTLDLPLREFALVELSGLLDTATPLLRWALK